MTGIVLHQPVLTLVQDENSLPLFLLRTDAPQFESNLTGETRTYAGGERIGTARVGVARSAQMQFAVDRATLNILGSWRGSLVCYRDGVQSKLFAKYFGIQFSPFPNGKLFTCTVRLEEQSYNEAAG